MLRAQLLPTTSGGLAERAKPRRLVCA